MKTHPWGEIRDRLKANPKRWERIQASTAALRAVHNLAALREGQEKSQEEHAKCME